MIKPSFLRPYEIADKAEEFRKLYVTPTDQIPLEIEHVIESVLKIRIDPRPGLSMSSRRNELAIDAFLSFDRKMIIVDNDQYILDQGG